MGLKSFLISSLVALTIIAMYVHGFRDVAPQAVIAAATACGLDVALRSRLTGVTAVPTGALISGLIVALLLPEGQPWYVPLGAASTAIASKHLLRRRGGNIFNPAAVGIAVSVLLFPGHLEFAHASFLEAAPRIHYARAALRMEGWSFLLQGGHGWTGSTSAAAVVILGAVLVYGVKRVYLVGSCLVTYVVLIAGFATVTGQDVAIRLLLEVFATGLLFFTFFMLTDPATSPRTTRGQIVYGGFTGLLSFLFRLIASPVQYLMLALLAANLAFNLQRTRVPAGHRGFSGPVRVGPDPRR